eukprot:5238989-Amphidinium_carterae.1
MRLLKELIVHANGAKESFDTAKTEGVLGLCWFQWMPARRNMPSFRQRWTSKNAEQMSPLWLRGSSGQRLIVPDQAKEKTHEPFNQQMQTKATSNLSDEEDADEDYEDEAYEEEEEQDEGDPEGSLNPLLEEKYDLVDADDYIVEAVDANAISNGKGKGKDKEHRATGLEISLSMMRVGQNVDEAEQTSGADSNVPTGGVRLLTGEWFANPAVAAQHRRKLQPAQSDSPTTLQSGCGHAVEELAMRSGC